MTDAAQGIVIAVDGGGSGCRAAVGTLAGGILGQATGGPANASTDFDSAMRNVRSAVAAACAQGGLSLDAAPIAAAHVGLAGVLGPEDATRVAQALPYAGLTVTDDRATIIAGALGEADGFVIALGTGTIIARRAGEAVTHVGGWGFQVSDQASGAWLGRQVLIETLHRVDGLAPHSGLSRAMLERFGGADGIVQFSLAAAPADYAALAPQIVAAAAERDRLGQHLLDTGAAYLARAVAALGHDGGAPICLTGGLGPSYAAHLPAPLRACLQTPQGSALDGALRLARRAAARQGATTQGDSQ